MAKQTTKKNEQPLADKQSADGSTTQEVATPETATDSADTTNTAESETTAAATSQTDNISENTTQEEGAEIKGVDVEMIPIYNINVDTTIVVCGTEKAIKLLEKGWNRVAEPANIICMGVDNTPFDRIMASIMADERVPDKFVFVPANCFPTHNVTLGDLITPRVRVLTDGTQTPLTRLPMLLESDFILQTLEALKSEKEVTEEMFFETYNKVAYPKVLIEQITMSSGNLVGYVTNPNPCMAKVAEALIRKKFICTNAEGFTPIQEHLAQLYGK